MNQQTKVIKRLGRRVRHLRKSKGWSQMYLASEAGLDKSYIGSIERGEVNPSVKLITRIAEALGVDILELFRQSR
jgi:transcriptional regulator with XRE-family HTH domain